MCLSSELVRKASQQQKGKQTSTKAAAPVKKGLSAEELFLKSLPPLPEPPKTPQPPVALPVPVGAPTGGAVLQKTITQKAAPKKAAVGLDALMINLAGDVRR